MKSVLIFAVVLAIVAGVVFLAYGQDYEALIKVQQDKIAQFDQAIPQIQQQAQQRILNAQVEKEKCLARIEVYQELKQASELNITEEVAEEVTEEAMPDNE